MTPDDRHDHDALDRRLREAFAPPADVGAIARRALERATVGAASLPPPTRRFALMRLAAAAALLVGALGLLWWATADAGRDLPDAPNAPRILAEAIGALDTAFPSCSNESQLAQLFDDRYGQKLHVRIDVTRPVAGPFACGSWPTATLMVADTAPPVSTQLGPYAAEPVLVQPVGLLVDAIDNDPRLASDTQAGVYVHRRVIDRLVIYELSRETEPACLDLFFTPSD
ncbi:MAG: hypothetical protein ACYTCU_00660 [Planctomycetota bacterium]